MTIDATKDAEIKRLTALLSSYQRRHNDVNAIVERIGALKKNTDPQTALMIDRIIADWQDYDMLYGD